MSSARIALVLRALDGGGMQRCMLELGEAFATAGCDVHLLVGDPEGPMRSRLPAAINLVSLAAQSPLAARVAALRLLGRDALPLIGVSSPRMLRHLAGLALELRRLRPQAVLAMGTQSNLAVLWARELAGLATRVVLCECTTLSTAASRSRRRFRRAYPMLVARHYAAADAIVAVSQAVAEDLAACTWLPRSAITVIPNWVTTEVAAARDPAPDHPWFADGVPLVLAVGRLHWQKDFATLVRAFALLRRRRPARLVVLGEGPERGYLQRLAEASGVAADVEFTGFVANPFVWMARAAVLAVTSVSEGFGNVIVEALACGLPVVATDCPGGPREILDGGRYGTLVPVGDAAALAEAMGRVIANPPAAAMLKRRAADFSLAAASSRYLDLMLGDKGDAA